jgi:putative acetyltransferase
MTAPLLGTIVISAEEKLVQIRSENEEDRAAIQAVNESAFAAATEARLVAALRHHARPFISLVAEDGGSIVGHIMFSPVVVIGHPELKLMGLAPMAVSPQHQRKGIGSALVRAGLEECRNFGFGAVVVLGHPEYYPRFGFIPASRYGLVCEYDVPEEAFMVTELQPGYLAGASGTVKYHVAFDHV